MVYRNSPSRHNQHNNNHHSMVVLSVRRVIILLVAVACTIYFVSSRTDETSAEKLSLRARPTGIERKALNYASKLDVGGDVRDLSYKEPPSFSNDIETPDLQEHDLSKEQIDFKPQKVPKYDRTLDGTTKEHLRRNFFNERLAIEKMAEIENVDENQSEISSHDNKSSINHNDLQSDLLKTNQDASPKPSSEISFPALLQDHLEDIDPPDIPGDNIQTEEQARNEVQNILSRDFLLPDRIKEFQDSSNSLSTSLQSLNQLSSEKGIESSPLDHPTKDDLMSLSNSNLQDTTLTKTQPSLLADHQDTSKIINAMDVPLTSTTSVKSSSEVDEKVISSISPSIDSTSSHENLSTAIDLKTAPVLDRISAPSNIPVIGGIQQAAQKAKPTCAGGNDPFFGTPVDAFQPPSNAPTVEHIKWKKAVSAMMTDLKKMKVGGEPLRRYISEEVGKLELLRLDMFCQYL